MMVAVSTRAGYVELYKEANFKTKLLRVDNVLVDVCYNFICDKLDDTITSALWHGLPEKGSLFEGGDAVISFITDKDCSGGEVRRWAIKTQSSTVTNFPANFRLDGIGSAISSFKVWNTGTDGGLLNICAASESTVVSNTTSNELGEMVGSKFNDTVDSSISNNNINNFRMTSLQIQIAIVTIAKLFLAINAGYVDLFRDADYKHKLARQDYVEVDSCYTFACEKLDDTITSAKWSGLSETTYHGEEAMIAFYTERGCQGHDIWWRVKTQSDDDLYFPSNFRLDGINDAISSFMIWDTKKIYDNWLICTTESGIVNGTNTTNSSTLGSDSTDNVFLNTTAGYL
ncbi:hypothetical protein PRNP1_010604 [Phytophthora ramorum]